MRQGNEAECQQKIDVGYCYAFVESDAAVDALSQYNLHNI